MFDLITSILSFVLAKSLIYITYFSFALAVVLLPRLKLRALLLPVIVELCIRVCGEFFALIKLFYELKFKGLIIPENLLAANPSLSLYGNSIFVGFIVIALIILSAFLVKYFKAILKETKAYIHSN